MEWENLNFGWGLVGAVVPVFGGTPYLVELLVFFRLLNVQRVQNRERLRPIRGEKKGAQRIVGILSREICRAFSPAFAADVFTDAIPNLFLREVHDQCGTTPEDMARRVGCFGNPGGLSQAHDDLRNALATGSGSQCRPQCVYLEIK